MKEQARRLASLLRQPYDSPAEAMVRMVEAAFMIERLLLELETKEDLNADRQA